MLAQIGQQAILGIVTHLACFAVTWWALQALNFDKLLRANKVVQARLLYILLTISIGSLVGNFVLDYLAWSGNLTHLFNG
ncbi:MAG: DUF1146 family protein [Bacillus sp. (in: firmicutes)]